MLMPETRREYLDQLNRELLWRQSRREADSVMRDYEEFFEIGMAEGKTEAELCRRFGTPKAVARSVTGETERVVRIRRTSGTAVFRIFGTLALVLYVFYKCFIYYYLGEYGTRIVLDTDFSHNPMVWLPPIMLALGLWLLWRRGFLPQNTLDRTALLSVVMPIIIWFTGYSLTVFCGITVSRLEFEFAAYHMAPTLFKILAILMAAEVGFLLLCVAGGLWRSAWIFLGSTFSFGSFLSLASVRIGITSVSSLTSFAPYVNRVVLLPLVPMAGAAVGAGLLALLIRRKGRLLHGCAA